MPGLQTNQQLAEELLKRKIELLDRLQLNAEKWSELQQRLSEIEERGSLASLAAPYEGIDEQTIQELGRVQKALQKIELHTYGICELCGQQISRARLEALPDAERCLNCASQTLPEFGGRPEDMADLAGDSTLPPELIDLDDADVAEWLQDRILAEGIVAAEELTVSCEDGIVRLEGFLPSEKSRQLLLGFLTDTIGIADLEDHLAVDPLLWENPERTPGLRGPANDYERLAEGEDAESSPEPESEQSGLPMEPPDKLIPEK